MGVYLISTPLTTEQKLAVVSVADVKLHARITDDSEDALIETYIETAYDFLSGPDGYLNGCCLLEEEFEFYFDKAPATNEFVELPMRPVLSGLKVSDVSSMASDGSYTALSTNAWYWSPGYPVASVRAVSGQIWPVVTPYHAHSYRTTFIAGFGTTAATVPNELKLAIKLLASTWFMQREAVGDTGRSAAPNVNYGLRQLLSKYYIAKDHS